MPFRRMQELQSQDFTSNCLLYYVCGREFCAAGLSTHRTRETRQLFEGHRQQKGHLQGHLQGLRMGQHDMSHHLIWPESYPLTSESSDPQPVVFPLQTRVLTRTTQCPIGLCPNIPLQASESSPVVFDVSGSAANLVCQIGSLQTNSDRVVVLSFGNPWGAPSTQPTSNLGFRYRTFLFLWWLGLRTGLTQVTLW